MKLLIIIISHALDIKWNNNIKILNDYMNNTNIEVEYCGISNQDDFNNYESIIPFRYKIINTKLQNNKLCDFITDYKSELKYDWYMKIRPDVKLLENINFNIFSEYAINALARVYYGPKKIKYGMSVNGEGVWKNVGCCYYNDVEKDIILDNTLLFFHKNIININAFDKIDYPSRDEWHQTQMFNERKIPLNVIGIYFENTKYNTFPGNINMNE